MLETGSALQVVHTSGEQDVDMPAALAPDFRGVDREALKLCVSSTVRVIRSI